MKYLLIFFFAAFILLSCNQKSQQPAAKQPDNKTSTTGYVISKDGIGDLKVGMSLAEVEKLLGQKFNLKLATDSTLWQDTTLAKYKDLDVSLYFERQYSEENVYDMQLTGVSTSSPLCKTASGIGIGDEKSAIISAYDDSPINMGPDYDMVNDTTWVPSKTKFSINVKDDKWDKELVFQLVNKKVASIQARILMGE
jgi:hypothetical protein